MKNHTFYRFSILFSLTLLLFASACGPSEQKKHELTKRNEIECLDSICDGDAPPSHDALNEVAMKVNGRWLIGPKYYFGSGSNSASFEWWDHKPLDPRSHRPPDAQALAVKGEGRDFLVRALLRSTNIPNEPNGYHLIKIAEEKGWVKDRVLIKPGLLAVKMRHVIGPKNQYIDHVTYYIATDIKGMDGLPPVATCNHDHLKNQGGSGFMWKSGIWVGINFNQKHCEDWPEIFQETIRVLEKLRME